MEKSNSLSGIEILGGLYKIGRQLRKNVYTVTDETNGIYEEMVIKVTNKKGRFVQEARVVTQFSRIQK
tara:strand:- start:375 stop:578 length:204 start_codon:yes stop_codon:yes gene_type:complete